MAIRAGDTVFNPSKPEWGQGEVLHMEGDVALVRFHNGAVRKLKASFLEMAGSSAEAQEQPAPAGPENAGGGGDGIISRVLAMLSQAAQAPAGMEERHDETPDPLQGTRDMDGLEKEKERNGLAHALAFSGKDKRNSMA